VVSKGTNSKPAHSGDFWNYVPHPARTVLYALLAVFAFASTEWVPQVAQQMEQTRLQQRHRDARSRALAEYEEWRRQYPHLDQQSEELFAQDAQQEETGYQVAQPSDPMSPMSSESTTPPSWN
jgi:hypothetical protein